MQPEQDISFEEFIQEALLYPCPCEDCQNDLQFDTPERAQQYLNQLLEIWETLITPSDGYEAPPTSPTNHQMHAINGNIKTPFVRDVADVINGFRDAYNELPDIYERFRGRGKHSSEDAMRHYKKYFSNHPSGKFFDAGTPEYDEWLSVYEKSLKPSKLKKTKKITNKEQHATNGNPQVFKKPNIPDAHFNSENNKWEWIPHHEPQTNIDPVDTTQELYDHLSHGDNPAQLPISTAPTNKEMHAYNGNMPKFGPRTKKQHEKTNRKQIRNAKKRAETKAYLKVIKASAAPFPQNRPKQKKKNALPKSERKIVKLEDKVARYYNKFLYQPSLTAQRIGSTGDNPTKIIHGHYKRIIPMGTIDWGTNPTLGTATSLLAFLSPVMFKNFSSVSNFKAPVVVAVAATNSVAFNVTTAGPGSASLLAEDYTNGDVMKNETLGTTSQASPVNTPARFLGGSVSVECRCPMSTTAPPFIYGGLLPENIVMSTQSLADNAFQLVTQTGAQMEVLTSTKEIPGFSGSAVYHPNNAKSLEFTNNVANNYTSVYNIDPSSIPYVGLNGCPTNATVVVTFNGWFEIQQTRTNAFYSGWRLGPKVSTEDIFDRLTRRKPTSQRIIDITSNYADAVSATMQVAENISKLKPQPHQKTISEELQELKEVVKHLKLQIEADEDEKYFDIEATPSLDEDKEDMCYKGLSKSTIDLAINLKKSLTPGSVTNKTIQTTHQ